MRKVIRFAKSREIADRMVAAAKLLPGVTYVTRYTKSSKFHIMVCGDFSDEVEAKLLDGHRNLAK